MHIRLDLGTEDKYQTQWEIENPSKKSHARFLALSDPPKLPNQASLQIWNGGGRGKYEINFFERKQTPAFLQHEEQPVSKAKAQNLF